MINIELLGASSKDRPSLIRDEASITIQKYYDKSLNINADGFYLQIDKNTANRA
jgi:hypothetical protein